MKRKKSSSKTKRTLTPEHIAKMQEGKVKAKRHRDREESVCNLEKRVTGTETSVKKMLQSVSRKDVK